MPSITQLLNHISTESKGTLIAERVENIGGHYSKTLRLWKESFLGNFDAKIRPALRQEHAGMSDEEVEVFKRKWEVSISSALLCLSEHALNIHEQYYFTYCEAGFMTKTLGDVIITVGREGALELMEGIPL